MRVSFILLLLCSMSARAESSLADFLQNAWRRSPIATSEQKKGEESEQLVKSSRAKYFPHLSLAAIDSTGFPSSSSLLHVGGLMGSAFRAGPAGGVIVQQTVYDFGRISSLLESAKAEKSLNEAKLAEEKWRYLSSVGELYLNCARARSLLEQNDRMMFWAKLILKESTRFTKTGQRSVIDNSLVVSKVNDLSLQQDELKKLQSSMIEQMKLYGEISGCTPLAKATSARVADDLTVEEPSVLLAKAQIELSQANLNNAKASQLPTLDVMGSAGYMDHARLVDRQDYSASVGLIFPIWNGGEDAHREQAFKSQVDYQSDILKATQVDFKTKLKNLVDERKRTRETLTSLEQNLDHVRATMKLAARRYQRLEGPLIDVRDAYAELQTIEYQRIRLLYSLATSNLQLSLLKTR